MDESARIDRLEARVTEQEAVIDDLNRVVAEQWRLIDRLGRGVEALREQVETVAERGGSRRPELPPHY